MDTDEIAYNLCCLMEPHPPLISARDARQSVRNFQWASCCDYWSPDRWWVAEIGTDHGPPKDDDQTVRWRPVPELLDQMEQTWRIVTEMKDRGWLFHVLAMADGWVVNGTRYDLPPDKDWKKAMLTSDFVQQQGETEGEAIGLAAVDALTRMQKT